jgi:mono/diheme cytochrome c family protein
MTMAGKRVLLLAGLFAAACGGGGGGGDDGDDGPLAPPGGDEPYVFPPEAHSGFDGTATFKVPLATNLKDPTWEVENPALAAVTAVPAPPMFAEFGESWAMVTTKGAGTTKIVARAGDQRAETTLTIATYEAAKVTAGASRYTMGAAGAPACAGCHGLANGVDHSPLQLAYYADEDILAAITTGKYPDGYELRGVQHAFMLAEGERAGIVPYLRSLPPRGF